MAIDSERATGVDTAMQAWRQGDLALDERWFIHVGDPQAPLTAAAAEVTADGGDLQALTSEVEGLVVLTQTCDVVRSCVDRPFLEVAPLVRVEPEELLNVKRGRRPHRASLPALEPQHLVVDLDRVMTVEKTIVARWDRTPGYVADADGRAFAQALSRKRARFAFPDAFNTLVKKLQSRLVDKHDRDSPEGRGLRALREIRVQATPSWGAERIGLFFWFIRAEEANGFEGKSWADLQKAWLGLVQKSGRFHEIDGQVVALEDLTAADYVGSDLLDLSYLSSRE